MIRGGGEPLCFRHFGSELLESLPIFTDDAAALRALHGTYQLAHEYGVTTYDAAYLELAMRLGAPLAILDKQLVEASKKAGVKIFRH